MESNAKNAKLDVNNVDVMKSFGINKQTMAIVCRCSLAAIG